MSDPGTRRAEGVFAGGREGFFCFLHKSDINGMFNWSKVQIRSVLDPCFGRSTDISFLIYKPRH